MSVDFYRCPNALALDNDEPLTMNDKVIELCDIPLEVQSEVVENYELRALAKRPLEVKRELRFGTLACCLTFVCAGANLKFFGDHSCSVRGRNLQNS